MRGWVPLHKALVRELPKDRPYTRLEAMFSLTVNYDNGDTATVQGYASLWRWSCGKVRRFLDEVGVALEYPENTTQKQNQRGQIMIQIADRWRTDGGQIKIIDSKWLASESNRRRTDDGQKADRSWTAIKEPKNLEPNPEPKLSLPKGRVSPDSATPQDLASLWNEIVGKPSVMELSKGRTAKARLRLKERSLDQWREVFEQIKNTPFLCGENDRGWRATFDWIISNDENALKVLEGKYGRNKNNCNWDELFREAEEASVRERLQ